MHRYALFGHPIAHTLSPTIHLQFAKQTHQILEYQAIDVQPEQFEATVMEFFQAGGMGANVTVPYKERALKLCDVLSFEARRAQSVNTLMRQSDGAIFGHNTDGSGLMNHLKSVPIALQDKKVLLLGAGGAAKGAVSALLHEPIQSLVVMNRTLEKAEHLVSTFPADNRLDVAAWNSLTQSFDLIINATSVSLSSDQIQLHQQLVHQQTIAYDMFYDREVTKFNAWAQSAGASTTLDGLGMLVHQAALGFELWRQVAPDVLPVYQKLKIKS